MSTPHHFMDKRSTFPGNVENEIDHTKMQTPPQMTATEFYLFINAITEDELPRSGFFDFVRDVGEDIIVTDELSEPCPYTLDELCELHGIHVTRRFNEHNGRGTKWSQEKRTSRLQKMAKLCAVSYPGPVRRWLTRPLTDCIRFWKTRHAYAACGKRHPCHG